MTVGVSIDTPKTILKHSQSHTLPPTGIYPKTIPQPRTSQNKVGGMVLPKPHTFLSRKGLPITRWVGGMVPPVSPKKEPALGDVAKFPKVGGQVSTWDTGIALRRPTTRLLFAAPIKQTRNGLRQMPVSFCFPMEKPARYFKTTQMPQPVYFCFPWKNRLDTLKRHRCPRQCSFSNPWKKIGQIL